MKKVLITGKDSYIGRSVEDWLGSEYIVDTLDMKDISWKDKDFSQYDVIFHVAGIAHVSSDPKMKSLYYKVNRDLTIKVAEKAKSEGVKQFIFMSSIIVYGNNGKGKTVISQDTIPQPDNFYGDSKLQAEDGIRPLNYDNFKIAILRPPMIYGKGSKGNYHKLSKLAKKIPFFPDVDNERSMLYISNLCEFIKGLIDKEASGLFFPQNKEYVKTSHMVKQISQVYGNRIVMVRGFNFFFKLLSRVKYISKIFGTLVYERSMSEYEDIDYQVINFKNSIEETEK